MILSLTPMLKMPMNLSVLVVQNQERNQISVVKDSCIPNYSTKMIFLIIQHILLSIFDEGFECAFPFLPKSWMMLLIKMITADKRGIALVFQGSLQSKNVLRQYGC